tara:strand:+ start:85 stop:513 length:429 start_codon:yes stop_codon:yes gene_type:complete
MRSNLETGKMGEHICMVELMKMGVACEIVNLETVDIVAHVNKHLLRIQVKTSILKRNRKTRLGGGTPGYQFATCHGGKKTTLDSSHCDIIAFVAFDAEKVLFMPISCLKGQVTKRFPPSKFEKDDISIRSWRHCLDCVFLPD